MRLCLKPHVPNAADLDDHVDYDFRYAADCLSTAEGAEWKSGLAWALIGGLTSSFFLTLIVVPVVYMKVDEWKEKIPAFFSKPSDILYESKEQCIL